MKRKMVWVWTFVLVLAAWGVTAAFGAQDDTPASASTCPDFGRLDYNYACRNGGWWPPAATDESFNVAHTPGSSLYLAGRNIYHYLIPAPPQLPHPCPDFGRLDYNYACQNAGWRPPAQTK